MKPYYVDEWVTIYYADCRDVLSLVSFDAVVTDPPYGVNVAAWDKRTPHELVGELLALSDGPMAWFGASPQVRIDMAAFDPPPERMLVWAPTFSLAQSTSRGIYYRWHPVYLWRVPKKHTGPHSDVLTHSTDGRNHWNHPGTKPLELMQSLVGLAASNQTILDPFMGSGTTLVAAKSLNRRAIGIEIEERYCEIAARRCSQEVLGLAA